MINRILVGWDLMRILRFVVGIAIIFQAFPAKEYLLMGVGGLFSTMALLNMGCCASGACQTPMVAKKVVSQNVEYEEIK